VAPWMAGGGGTVRSVPNEKSIDPFLSPYGSPDGGTFVVMVDGSVRYLKKGMSDAAFKAICTLGAPGPEDAKFGEEYPPVTPPKEEERPLGKDPVAVGKGTGKGNTGEKSSTPANWKQFVSKEGGFSILMPPDAGPYSKPIENGEDAGSLTDGFKADVIAAKTAYLVYYYKLGKADSAERVLEAFKSGLVTFSSAKISQETRITNGSTPGREWKSQQKGLNNQSDWHITRVFVTQDRVYILDVGTADASAATPDYRAFFDSFKLISAK